MQIFWGIRPTGCSPIIQAISVFTFLVTLPVGASSSAPSSNQSVTLPEGTIERRTVVFEAPEVACESYIQTYRERIWLIGVRSPAAFADMLSGLPLNEVNRAALLTPSWWRPNPNQGGFEVRPTAEFLRNLHPKERGALYTLLAGWQTNRPERWPLVLPDRDAIVRLRALGHPPVLVDLLETCSYPFAGGLAFSDFSLLAEAGLSSSALRDILRDVSSVTGFLPRLKISTAVSVSSALSYWTVDNNNPFARPMLEALLRSETDAGMELTAFIPGASRVLSHTINPNEVRHDASLTSFMISSTLSGPPPLFRSSSEFELWLDREFVRVQPPYRFGDMMVLEHPNGLPVSYACAYIADNFAFAKDPVGLGLWRFMYLGEILSRNPHFAGGTWAGFRRRSPGAQHAATNNPFRTGSAGPWGVLRHAELKLTPPDQWLDAYQIFRPPLWEFHTKDWNQIEALLRRSQLTPAQLAALLDPAIRSMGPEGGVILKAPAVVRDSLSPVSRETIYNFLGLHGSNALYHVPLLVPPNAADIEAAALNPRLREALFRLAYRRKEQLCLSDTDLLAELVADDDEARRLKRLLLGTSALQVELLRASLDRTAEVTEFWKKTDGRSTTALLRWLERSPDLEAIDIINLLPSIPQRFLNAYPDNLAAGRSNCFWTSLNFFAKEPDNRFLASEPGQPDKQDLIERELLENYRPVSPPYRFGDILCLVDSRPVGFGIVHMMNYVADDIVFTKNGFSPLAPTVLMRLGEVERLYPTVFELQLRGLRRKAEAAR